MSFRQRTFAAKPFYVYVSADGTQYLPLDAENFQQIDAESVPDTVECFEFALLVRKAKDKQRERDEMTTRLLEAGIQGRNGQLSPHERKASAAIAERVRLEHLQATIASWNLMDEDGTVPVTIENLLNLEPGWLYDIIVDADNLLNSAKNSPGR